MHISSVRAEELVCAKISHVGEPREHSFKLDRQGFPLINEQVIDYVWESPGFLAMLPGGGKRSSLLQVTLDN